MEAVCIKCTFFFWILNCSPPPPPPPSLLVVEFIWGGWLYQVPWYASKQFWESSLVYWWWAIGAKGNHIVSGHWIAGKMIFGYISLSHGCQLGVVKIALKCSKSESQKAPAEVLLSILHLEKWISKKCAESVLFKQAKNLGVCV